MTERSISSDSIKPFCLSVLHSTLDDLQIRLSLTRWPDAEPVTDWSQGVPLAEIQELCKYWQAQYDWRRCEALLNTCPQFTTAIDGLEIYFLHIRSKHEDALPLLVTHGWPGSVLEFRHVIAKLVDPEAHGGEATDAFHLVIPALPGYAFSGKPKETGWGIERTARAWAQLMERLGYADAKGGWAAQGGDWGAHVTACLGQHAPRGLKGVHFNSLYFDPKVYLHLTEHLSYKRTLTTHTERNPDSNREQGRRATRSALRRHPRRRPRRLLAAAIHPPANHQLRARRFTGCTSRLDLREVPRLVPPRRGRRERLQQRRDARHDHAVLAVELGRILRSLLLGVRGGLDCACN
jgi:pimeloyl-ACP methyl ester carboxylesterase